MWGERKESRLHGVGGEEKHKHGRISGRRKNGTGYMTNGNNSSGKGAASEWLHPKGGRTVVKPESVRNIG